MSEDKARQSYLNSNEHKDAVMFHTERGGNEKHKPNYEDFTKGRRTTSRRLNNRMAPLSYPVATGPSQRTGDRLVIKCLKFEPPGMGSGATITPINMFKKGKGSPRELITKEDRQDIEAGKSNIFITDDEGNRRPMTQDDKPSFKFNVEDANTRLGKGANRLMKYLIELPIPQDLTDSNSVTWGEDRANALELGALTVAQNAMGNSIGDSAQRLIEASVTAFNTGIDIPGLNSETQGAVRAALSGAAVGALGSNVSPQSVISRSTGQILNNNLELLFKGVNLRSFPYSITFSPRSPIEANVVKKIIRRLKASMAPKAGEFNGGASGIFIQSPDVFQLKFLKDDVDHPFLHSFKLCALTGMSVNYTNAGTYTSYEDGTPVNIRMSLTFKELNPIYHEDYQQVGAGPGVGY